MKKRSKHKPFGGMGAALLAGTAQADKWSDQFPHIKNTGDIAGECSYESMSQKDYSGRKADDQHPCRACYGRANSCFTRRAVASALTGAEVNVIHTPAGDLILQGDGSVSSWSVAV